MMDADGKQLETAFALMTEIAIVAQLAAQAFERRMPQGLTLAQFSVLNHLARTGGRPTPAELASAMQVTKGAMTNTVGHLERGGLIEIDPHESDGRSKRVRMTDKGHEQRGAAIAALAPELAALTGAVGNERLAAQLPGLRAIRLHLDGRRSAPATDA
jgi:DNA-binding MarR family transcriptional regulator